MVVTEAELRRQLVETSERDRKARLDRLMLPLVLLGPD